ncbi:MAG TPA: DUF222 domain-containing protein, partial [Acidimicrobiia bacterium]|nr:DUF222 domain-containing protein [Acidimicrobiia bacterium]
MPQIAERPLDVDLAAPVLAPLAAAVDGMVALDLHSLSDDELSALLVGLEREVSRLEGVRARMVSRWDARKVWTLDRARSAASWLARRCRIPLKVARRQVWLARSLRDMPATARALCEGDIGADHAGRLARAAGHDRDAFERDETMLLGYARDLSFPDFDRAMAYWEQLADPDGVEDDAAAQYALRSLHLSQTMRGTWYLDGVADAISGTIVNDVLTRIEDELFEADWAEAKAVHGDDTRAEHLARTPAQRRLDALVEMARRAATPKEGSPPRPLFTAYVDYPTLSGRLCELANGTVVTPGQLLPWLTEADIERVVFDGPSRVVDLGAKRRLFRGATRRVVELRDRHCTHPGCDVPAEWCDVDHRLASSQGGLTVQANGGLACPPHNPGR